MHKMETKKKSPEVRFAGFTEEWKDERLEHLGHFLKGNGYSKSDIRKSGHPIILYGRLYTNYNLLIDNVDTFTEPKEGSIYSEGGEVIIPSSGETAEDIIIASVVKNEQVILGGDLNIIRPKENLNSEFLALSISNGLVYKELVKKAQGKSVVHIRNTDLQETQLPYPDIYEQEKIADLFLYLNKLISNHQTQLTKLKNLKKAMLTKMFPQNGASVPEIRFKGFDGEWKELYFDKLFEFSKGKGLSKNDVYNSGTYECILYGHLYTTYGMVTDKVHFFTNKRLDNRVESVFGDVLIPSSDTTPTGLAQAICVERDGVVLGGDINILRPKKGLLGSFLSFNINANRVKLLPLIKGSTVRHLYNEDLKTVKISVPKDINEQYKISQYFKNIDILIENHQEQLKKLNNIKKACLNKLFVS